jgi:hypothetical protein
VSLLQQARRDSLDDNGTTNQTRAETDALIGEAIDRAFLIAIGERVGRRKVTAYLEEALQVAQRVCVRLKHVPLPREQVVTMGNSLESTANGFGLTQIGIAANSIVQHARAGKLGDRADTLELAIARTREAVAKLP